MYLLMNYASNVKFSTISDPLSTAAAVNLGADWPTKTAIIMMRFKLCRKDNYSLSSMN